MEAGDGAFSPNNPVTREQLAAILYRYAQDRGMDASARAELSGFSDRPSAWAAEAVRWAAGAGVISGRAGGALNPSGRASRAEAAVMLRRFLTAAA